MHSRMSKNKLEDQIDAECFFYGKQFHRDIHTRAFTTKLPGKLSFIEQRQTAMQRLFSFFSMH